MRPFFAISLLLLLPLFWLNASAQDSINIHPQSYTVVGFNISGNEKTKAYIIEREITVTIGDTVTDAELESILIRSRQNIFNTQLFNFVEVTAASPSKNTLIFNIEVQERWYFWPLPILENADRNFNTWWQDKDFGRLNYGVFLRQYNFRGRDETVQINFQWGYEREISATYRIPYIDKSKKNGLSFKAGYSRQQEVNYASEDNKRVFYELEDEPLQENVFGGIEYRRRGALYTSHWISLNYNSHSINDSLLHYADDYFEEGDLSLKYLSLNYTFRFDKRDNINYPLKGDFVQFYSVYRNGMLFSKQKDFELMEASLTLSKYFKISNRWYYAASAYGKKALINTPPYALQEGLGYSNFVRGYELYVFDAQDYFLFKSHLKFNLIPTRIKELPIIKNKKFKKYFYAIYLNLNADAGYAEDALYYSSNPMSNSWLFGYGTGLDLVSYYDIVVRAEYSRNIENEDGFYLHFKKAF